MAQLKRSPFQATRRTIDVSGDGTNNAGRDVRIARDEAVAEGVTINGLVILSQTQVPWNPEHTNPPGGLEKYFRDNVAGGPGSFVVAADGFESFGKAIIKKMIAEIALLRSRPARTPLAAPAERRPRRAADRKGRSSPQVDLLESFQLRATLELF